MPLLPPRFLLLASAAILSSSCLFVPAFAQDSDSAVQLSPQNESMAQSKQPNMEVLENSDDDEDDEEEDDYDYEDDYDPYADSITSPRPPGAFDEDDPDGLKDIEDLDPELTKEYREEVEDHGEEEGVHERNARRREEMEIRRELRKKRRDDPYTVDPY